jgi:hypothetical protein
MTAEQAPPITLPALTLITLADLLTELDEFLRSGGTVATNLADFLARNGHTHPGFAACNLIDHVSFTAADLRKLTHGLDKTAAESAYLADHLGEEYQPGS